MLRCRQFGSDLCSNKGWKGLFLYFVFSPLHNSHLLSSPIMRQRCCCGDRDDEGYHYPHIPAASGGLRGTTALQEV